MYSPTVFNDGEPPFIDAEYINRLEMFLANLPEIQHGSIMAQTTSTSEVMKVRVNFPQTFSEVPHVAVTPQSTVVKSAGVTWGISDVDEGGFDLNYTRSTATNTVYHWVAVAGGAI